MRSIISQAVLLMCLGAALTATSQAKPVINGSLYIESVYHDCDPSADSKTCMLLFTKVPAGKVLVVQNFNCNITLTSGASVIRTAFLKLANGGVAGVQVAIPMPAPQVGSFATNQQMAGFAAAGYAPSFVTEWSSTADGDMTCTVSGWLQ